MTLVLVIWQPGRATIGWSACRWPFLPLPVVSFIWLKSGKSHNWKC
ncbi:ArsB/NhaD family transporter [Bacillus sp. FJAT-53060]|nr:ArsB/NhaD family transporter [Bacillus stratosphericus]